MRLISEKYLLNHIEISGNCLGAETFRARTLEEIQRAKRYPNFVSLLLLDFTYICDPKEIDEDKNIAQVFESLKSLVRNSVRETDLIGIRFDLDTPMVGHPKVLSGSHVARIGILLIETNQPGAITVSRRLKTTIKYFLCNNIKSPLKWRVPIRAFCFPGLRGKPEYFIKALDKISPQ